MFRPLAFVAMRQQADEARHAQPFALARRDELVEHHLRAIGEIAELRLPQRQRLRLGERIAVFEAEHRLFREHRIDDLETALAVADMVERDVARLGLLVDQHGMALRERAALAVLAGQADRIALVEQRAESQRLAGRPIDALAVSTAWRRLSRKRWIVLWTLKPLGHRGDARGELLDLVEIDAGLAAPIVVDHILRRLEAGPAPVEPVGLVGLVALARLEFGLQAMAPVAAQSCRLRPR